MSTLRTLWVLGVFALAAPPAVRAEAGFAGEWKGVYDGQASFALHLTEEDGVLTGTIDVPGQGIRGARLELETEGDTLSGSFTVPDGSKTSFTGERGEDGGVAGTYEQGYNSGTFRMERVQEEAPQ